MNRQSAIIIIVLVGILGFLGGYFVFRWQAGQKRKAVTVLSYSSLPPPATVTGRVEPKYPASALKDKLEGTVKLMVAIGEDGSAKSTEVVQGVRRDIDSAAKEAVKLWRFAPTSGWAIVSLDFKLDSTRAAKR